LKIYMPKFRALTQGLVDRSSPNLCYMYYPCVVYADVFFTKVFLIFSVLCLSYFHVFSYCNLSYWRIKRKPSYVTYVIGLVGFYRWLSVVLLANSMLTWRGGGTIRNSLVTRRGGKGYGLINLISHSTIS